MRRFLATFLLAAAAIAAHADDVILLENGRELRGRIVEERADAVKIDIGGGKLTIPRTQIREVRREGSDAPVSADPSDVGTDPAVRREEHAILYREGERVGIRTFRASKLADGWLFEEEVRLQGANGTVTLDRRTVERDDLELRPLSFQVRETNGTVHTSIVGEVAGGRLRLTFAKDGDKRKAEHAAPDDLRLPFAARELFLRETKALAAKLDAPVVDPSDGTPRPVAYREGGSRPLRLEGKSLVARVVVRTSGKRAEREWIAPDGTLVLAELDGPSLVAIAASRLTIERLREGDTESVTGPDSAARMRYVDKVRGWRIGKPDPTWTFEKPTVEGVGALLVVRNEPLFATVDVMTDPDASPRTRVEDAAEALQRVCRAAAPDFKVLHDGWLDRDGERVYWMDATATTKGEATRTLARVLVKDEKVWRLLGACPANAFDALRGEIEKVLDSFVVE